MEVRRFFVKPSDIRDGLVTVRGDEFSHMTRTLRYKVGYKAVILANDGVERNCEIVKLDNDCATLKILDERRVAKKTKYLALYAGVLKNNKLDFVLQKCVELGVDKLVPFISKNSAESKFAKDRADRIALEAAKQCGAVYLSEVGELTNFKDMLDSLRAFDTVVVAYEDERENRIDSVDFSGERIAVVVGPEGGFKKEEIDALLALGASAVTLGTRILRAETASIVACALALHEIGDLYV